MNGIAESAVEGKYIIREHSDGVRWCEYSTALHKGLHERQCLHPKVLRFDTGSFNHEEAIPSFLYTTSTNKNILR
jgi:hypothetical protein